VCGCENAGPPLRGFALSPIRAVNAVSHRAGCRADDGKSPARPVKDSADISADKRPSAELLTRDEPQRIAANVAKLRKLCAMTEVDGAERYLVRMATIFPSPFATGSAVCADCSDATEDTSAGGVD
jgi:hypothetical protein